MQLAALSSVKHRIQVNTPLPFNVRSADKTQFVARASSVHGASTLRSDRNRAGAEAHWTALLAFLRRVAAPR